MYFVFLEFLESRVEGALRDLRDALQPWKKSKSPVHVTVRGPYKTKPDNKLLRKLASGVRGEEVRILGAGYFTHGQSFSVFLRAESDFFRNLWWKPDFPAKIDEIQPHITVFESKDLKSALDVLKFLEDATISIRTTSVQLSVFKSGQPDLFNTCPVNDIPPNVHPSSNIVAINDDVLPRAHDLGLRLNARRNELLASSRSAAQ